jgi:hypothetical protein
MPTAELQKAASIIGETIAECSELLKTHNADEVRQIREHRATRKTARMTKAQLKELLAKAGTEHTGFVILNAPWRAARQ